MSRDISTKKDKKVDLGDGAWVHVRRLLWGEVEDVNSEARDPKTGKVDERKRVALAIAKAITGFGGFTEGKAELAFPDDLQKVIDCLYIEEATKLYLAAISDQAEAEAELGN